MAQLRGERTEARPIPPELARFVEVDWIAPYTLPPGTTTTEAEDIWVGKAVDAYRRWREARRRWAEENGRTPEDMRKGGAPYAR